jgi:hypothetical protein
MIESTTEIAVQIIFMLVVTTLIPPCLHVLQIVEYRSKISSYGTGNFCECSYVLLAEVQLKARGFEQVPSLVPSKAIV